MKNLNFLFLFLMFVNTYAEVRIPQDSIRQPSDDLVFEGKVLTSEEAWRLTNRANDPLDLSKLNPIESTIWKNKIIRNLDPTLDQLSVESGSTLNFVGRISSNSGVLRFNVIPEGENNFYTIFLEKTLHSYLLRKNLLRKLGYNIPAMKYLKEVIINFENIEQRDLFLNRQIPESTFGASTRWTKINAGEYGDSLKIKFYDIILMQPKQTDHYNVAMGVPPKRITNRTLRSLAVPWSLVNVGESINKLSWYTGRVDNKDIVLPHFFPFAQLNTTKDDALWALRRMETFERSDIEEIVRESYYPEDVGKLLVEKLSSRLNSLKSIFNEKGKSLTFNSELSFEDNLQNGKLIKEEYPGYASRFAHGNPDSPFQDYQYNIFSKVQNAALSALIGKVNDELSLFNPNEERAKFHTKQFQNGLNHFIETGEFKEFGVGTWTSPIINGQLIISREIVLGNYLGTDNLVQLADTLGYTIDLGIHIGIENIPQIPTAAVRAGLKMLRTYTHLKPVKTLKESFKEPYKNLLVPIVKLQLKKRFNELSNLGDDIEDIGDIDDQKLGTLEELMSSLSESLGVGESIIVTDRLTPNALVTGSFSLMDTQVRLGMGVDQLVIKRFHIYRKNAETIQIYQDNGKALSLYVTADIINKIPIIRFRGTKQTGNYNLRVNTVNINSDLDENPEFFQNAIGIYELLENGSSELLDSKERPYKIKADFKDNSTNFGLLVWRSKYLKGNNSINVVTSKGHSSDYLVLTEHNQQGINYKDFVYDVLNYYLGEWLEDYAPTLNTWDFRNPGQSTGGVSLTKSARYESRIDNQKKHKDPFISLSTKKEGWSIGKGRIKKNIKEINTEYDQVIFDKRALENAKNLKLFDITINTNIYEDGIERLEQISKKEIQKIERKYNKARRRECDGVRARRIKTSRSVIECGNLDILINKQKICKKESPGTKRKAECLMKYSQLLKDNLEFSDFQKLIGASNIFVYGIINGFRTKSEILNDPIQSNTIGEVSGRYWNGPVEELKGFLEIQSGEFEGSWIRDTL